jgi:hypothetical protein
MPESSSKATLFQRTDITPTERAGAQLYHPFDRPTEAYDNHLYRHLEDEFRASSRWRQVFRKASDVNYVITRTHLVDLINQERGETRSRQAYDSIFQCMDQVGYGLRIPLIKGTSNRHNLFCFEPWRQAFFRYIADTDYFVELPTLSDDSALLPIAERRGARTPKEYTTFQPLVTEDRAYIDDDTVVTKIRSGSRYVGVELETEKAADCFEEGLRVLRERAPGRDGLETDGSGTDEQSQSEQSLRDEGSGQTDKSAGAPDPGDQAVNENESPKSGDSTVVERIHSSDGVFGYDWIRSNGDRSWTGRPFRSALYADIASMELPEDIDIDPHCVTLVNYGEPTVPSDADGLPEEFDLLWDDEEYKEDPNRRKANEYAIDYFVKGKFADLELSREVKVSLTTRLRVKTTLFHILCHYGSKQDSDGASPHDSGELEWCEEVREDLMRSLSIEDKGMGGQRWPEYDCEVKPTESAIYVSSFQQTKGK